MKKHLGSLFINAITFIAVTFLVGTFFYSCTAQDEPAADKTAKVLEPIRIGVAGSHSGDLASFGIPAKRAAELVVAKRNAMAGINGRKIELVVEPPS